MRPINKKTAKVFICLVCIALVFGVLFAFVPMRFNSFTFTSFAGAINKSTDLSGGVYAEYELDGEYSKAKINNSISTIREILEDNGYSGAQIYSLAGEKIRIDIGYQSTTGSFKDAYSLLNAVGIGVFELRSSSSADDTFIIGNKHISDVTLNTYNSTIYVMLEFNDEGVEAYEQMLEASSTIYVYMGGDLMTSFSSSNITASSSMPLSFASYDSAEDFMMKVKLGSMDVNLNSKTVSINTMSSTLSNSNFETNPNNEKFTSNVTFICGAIAIALVVLLGIAFLVWKSGVLGAFQLLALVFDAIIALFLIWAFPWVEISLSSLIAIALGFVIVLGTSFVYISRVEEEFKQGKTITASLESGFKKSLSPVVATGVVLTIIFGVVAIVASSELKVFGLITCIFSCLSMFNTAIMLPGFVNIFEAFNDGAEKPYRLKTKGDNNDEK